MGKNFKFYLGLFILALAVFSVNARPAKAADVCTQNTVVDVIARDPSGTYIPGANVELYKQGYDANGQIKPVSRVAAGNTDVVLGSAHLSFRNSAVASGLYALKIRTVNNESASFWYYNITLNCGETTSISKTLSGVSFVLRDLNGNLLTNTNFNFYSQPYNSSGDPAKVSRTLLANLNSGSNGSVKIYVPQGSVRSLDNSLTDYYAMELVRGSSKYYFFNIRVFDNQLTTVNYYLSGLHVKLQDLTGIALPAGTKVEVFKQEVTLDNNRQKGAKVGEFTLGGDGYGTIEVPAGFYVLGVKGQSNDYQYFWGAQAIDGYNTEVTMTSDQASPSVTTACQNKSRFSLTLRGINGEVASGLKYELYEQNTDANGLPTVGNRVGSGTVGDSGQAYFDFTPDPRKMYALKVWDKQSSRGDYWFYNVVRFVCDYNRSVSVRLPALKITLRDSAGRLKTNYNFSLYAQKFDSDGNPYFEEDDLIANLKTDSSGQARAYVAPFNTYRRGQSGYYALKVKDANGNSSNVYNIKMNDGKDTVFKYSFSSLSGELRDARKKALGGREIRLYEQVTSGGTRDLGNLLLKTKTTAAGRFNFEYPAGTYALVVQDDFKKDSIFWNITIKSGKNNTAKLIMNLSKFTLSDAQREGMPSTPTLKLYTMATDDGRKYYRDEYVGDIRLSSGKIAYYSLSAGPYIAIYTGKGGLEYARYFKAANGVITNVPVKISSKTRVTVDQYFKF